MTHDEHVAQVKADARRFFMSLQAAFDADVSHAILLPQLMLTYREVTGHLPELPDGMTFG